MLEQFLLEQLEIAFNFGVPKPEMPDSITQNLNPAFELRPYQEDAFASFIHYFNNKESSMFNANPFRQPGQWYRGNTHSHSTESDGQLSMSDRFAAYREAGYDFLVLTDHRATYSVPNGAKYVRVEITDATGKKAWLNPFFF